MSIYLNKNIFDVEESCIIAAPTGIGKSTALIDFITSRKIQCIIVSPLNELALQLQEKDSSIKAINSQTSNNIKADIVYNLTQGNSIIISLKIFSEILDMFYNIPVFIDECHKLIEYNELCDTEKVVKSIRDNKFKKIIGITATPLGLDCLLNLKIIKSDLKSEYIRHIFLDTINSYQLENILGCVYNLYKKHGKLVVMYNNKNECMRLSEELKLMGLKVLNYNSDLKEIRIINERFSEDFDILFCTSSLTTGVSIKDDYHAVCILRFFDTINAIPQFFARNRNLISKGTIIRSYYSSSQDFIQKFHINNYVGKTEANESLSNFIKEILIKLKSNICKEFLEIWLEKDGNYLFINGENHSEKIELKVNSKYVKVIENQREYFINNVVPKFDKQNYVFLSLMYELYSAASTNSKTDSILESYLSEYTYFKFTDDSSDVRMNFYDAFYEKIRKYYSDKAKMIASKTTVDSLDTAEFENMFLNKKYFKKNLKDYCINRFNLKNEIFKNKSSVNIFLNKIGYSIVHKEDGNYIEKI